MWAFVVWTLSQIHCTEAWMLQGVGCPESDTLHGGLYPDAAGSQMLSQVYCTEVWMLQGVRCHVRYTTQRSRGS